MQVSFLFLVRSSKKNMIIDERTYWRDYAKLAEPKSKKIVEIFRKYNGREAFRAAEDVHMSMLKLVALTMPEAPGTIDMIHSVLQEANFAAKIYFLALERYCLIDKQNNLVSLE